MPVTQTKPRSGIVLRQRQPCAAAIKSAIGICTGKGLRILTMKQLEKERLECELKIREEYHDKQGRKGYSWHYRKNEDQLSYKERRDEQAYLIEQLKSILESRQMNLAWPNTDNSLRGCHSHTAGTAGISIPWKNYLTRWPRHASDIAVEELKRDIEMQSVLSDALLPYEDERERRRKRWMRAFDYRDLIDRFEEDKEELQQRLAESEG